MSDYLGEIRTFLGSESDLPDNFYPLTGSSIDSSVYPKFALKVQKDPDYFQGFSVSDGKIYFPDWTGYYLTQRNENKTGVQKTDTMRAIMGSVHSYDGIFEEPILGAFTISDVDGTRPKNEKNESGSHTLNFNSSLGVKGQEGTVSPNVGDVTEPKNVSILYAICVEGN